MKPIAAILIFPSQPGPATVKLPQQDRRQEEKGTKIFR
jgi:hypothetical protein